MKPGSEAAIQHDIRVALGLIPDLRLFRNNVGTATHKGVATRYGLCVGSSDLIGILGASGRFVALEIKAEAGRISPEQSRFMATIRSLGGFATVVRSVPEAQEAIARARTGACE